MTALLSCSEQNLSINSVENFEVADSHAASSLLSISEKKNSFKSDVLARPVEKRYVCSMCNEELKEDCDLNTHLLTCLSKKRFMCEICDINFATKNELSNHLISHLTEKSIFDIPDEQFNCPSVVQNELATHTDEKPPDSGVCDEAFRFRNSFNSFFDTQRRILNVEKPYKCMICEKNFSHINSCESHFHSCSEDPFVCDFCGMCFVNSFGLEIHMRSHTNKRPYLCGVCSKSFASEQYFNVHMHTHENKSCFVCDICSRTFTAQHHLTMHMRIHERTSHACDVCKKSYSSIEKLKAHKCTSASKRCRKLLVVSTIRTPNVICTVQEWEKES